MNKPDSVNFAGALNSFTSLTKDLTAFLTPQPTKAEDAKQLLRVLYRNAVLNDKINLVEHGILPNLIYARFSEDQIWEQLELRNKFAFTQLDKEVNQLTQIPDEGLVIQLDEEEEEGSDDESVAGTEAVSTTLDDDVGELAQNYSGSDADTGSDNDSECDDEVTKKSKKKSHGYDKPRAECDEDEDSDEEMRKYLDKVEAQGDNLSDDGIDYFAELNDDEEEDEAEVGEEIESCQLEPASDGNTDAESDGDENSESKKPKQETKSSYEVRSERLNRCIAECEDELLAEKPWQLKGEIQAMQRPTNALIEEYVEFESTTRPAPINNEQITEALEDMIRQRIKDQAWDDVKQKAKITQTPQERRRELVLDQEKPKESLAQIYEKDYQKALAKLDPNYEGNDPDEPKEHKEIRILMKKLFTELDAASNFHFVPKPVAPEPKIITNTPAIAMEEVAPVAVSDANLLAPKEVFRGPKHELLGKSERTKTDKNRERRKKKQKQRAINRIVEDREKQRIKEGKAPTKSIEQVQLLKNVTKQRNAATIKTSNDSGALKTSKAFFSKLQESAANGTSGKALEQKRRAENSADKMKAKRVKL